MERHLISSCSISCLIQESPLYCHSNFNQRVPVPGRALLWLHIHLQSTHSASVSIGEISRSGTHTFSTLMPANKLCLGGDRHCIVIYKNQTVTTKLSRLLSIVKNGSHKAHVADESGECAVFFSSQLTLFHCMK